MYVFPFTFLLSSHVFLFVSSNFILYFLASLNLHALGFLTVSVFSCTIWFSCMPGCVNVLTLNPDRFECTFIYLQQRRQQLGGRKIETQKRKKVGCLLLPPKKQTVRDRKEYMLLSLYSLLGKCPLYTFTLAQQVPLGYENFHVDRHI